MKIRVNRALGYETKTEIVEADSFNVIDGDLYLYRGKTNFPIAIAVFSAKTWTSAWEVTENEDQK